MKKKIDLWCTGQVADARTYLAKVDGYSPEKVAEMSDDEVECAINKIAEENDFSVITKDNGQDIGLVPEEAWNQITWFQR
ncbi:hypothetical protein [Enterococcus termitis]|uniref:Uncharacterized protein n=1 Tax=Enterococcus termitis TaxID=332950 RepID=A0A1E5GJR3_9ENTE|nr:hypothetical protein [Enterococcus termitis]OEG12480.1 hypothetical protein BCR25_08055 [Enterococcus termitis]